MAELGLTDGDAQPIEDLPGRQAGDQESEAERAAA